jgi:hypothetical protein
MRTRKWLARLVGEVDDVPPRGERDEQFDNILAWIGSSIRWTAVDCATAYNAMNVKKHLQKLRGYDFHQRGRVLYIRRANLRHHPSGGLEIRTGGDRMPNAVRNVTQIALIASRAAIAWEKVKDAIRAGLIPPATRLQCFDCPKPAQGYDHFAGYDFPLKIQAVCTHCHGLRSRGRGEHARK